MSPSIIDKLNIPRDLVLDFLVTFARFEYALKRAGYLLGNEQSVSPDWDKFAKELADADELSLAPVFESSEYLEASPPMKQIKSKNSVGWVRLNPMKTRIESLLFDVRTVRNNLFHGGKFEIMSVEEPARNERLIRSCLAALDNILELPIAGSVAQYFREGV